MEAITITRPVLVKVRVTENYRKARAAALQGAAQRIETQLQQLEFQGKKILAQLEKQNPQAIPQTRQKIEEDKQGLLNTRQKKLLMASRRLAAGRSAKRYWMAGWKAWLRLRLAPDGQR